MENTAEIECASCGKVAKVSALGRSSYVVCEGQGCRKITTVRVGTDAKMYCEICADLVAISASSMSMMDFQSNGREIVILTQDGSRLYADKLSLMSNSEVFEKMFNTEMSEKQTGTITIDYVKTETVFRFLCFIYQGDLREVPSGGDLKELLELAHQFDVKKLVHVLDSYIMHKLAKAHWELPVVKSSWELAVVQPSWELEVVQPSWELELMELGFVYDLPKTKQFVKENATPEIMRKVCESLGEDCPWYVEYFKTVLASPNMTWSKTDN